MTCWQRGCGAQGSAGRGHSLSDAGSGAVEAMGGEAPQQERRGAEERTRKQRQYRALQERMRERGAHHAGLAGGGGGGGLGDRLWSALAGVEPASENTPPRATQDEEAGPRTQSVVAASPRPPRRAGDSGGGFSLLKALFSF